ncbi:MAG TPA: hypothetical protein PKE30_00685 [Niabella sp.]|nr:hypothetical protein [Niabella sp.]
MSILPIISRQDPAYRWLDIAVMTAFTALSVYNGQATIFYIVYLFWWNEFLSVIIKKLFDKLYKRKKEPADSTSNDPSAFLLTIYWVFIVVIFGLVANWNDVEAMMTNFGVLFFKNLYFNLNMLFIVGEACFLNLQCKGTISAQSRNGFTANMIVLHISIILGAFVLFGVVRRLPDIFTPGNKWGSVLVIAPFLLLRFLVQFYRKKSGL